MNPHKKLLIRSREIEKEEKMKKISIQPMKAFLRKGKGFFITVAHFVSTSRW
jgi:hypothetical protein